MTLEEEEERATSMLLGRVVVRVLRFREHEVLIEFDDGTRLFVDAAAPLELSITQP
ncbi:hypothetical protein [Sphingomonas sp. VDB2]|uniref:hypothetical protein n=1 Tax=Sphingomonas sp. VDB2 TaxID=3228751 RepID=UPI003A7F6F93